MIRRERHEDEAEISRVIEAAFGDRDPATFVEHRASPGYVPELAFVTEEQGEIVANTTLSRVGVEGPDVDVLIPQFGFRSATELGLERPDPRIPEAAWMVRPLRAYDPALRGRVVYPSFFPPPPGHA